MQVDTVTPSGPVAAALLGLPHIRGVGTDKPVVGNEQGCRDAPLVKVRFVPRIYAALADLVEFLVKRCLHTFNGVARH